MKHINLRKLVFMALLIAAIVTGAFTGVAAMYLNRAVKKIIKF